MKATIEISPQQIQEAIEEYMTRRNLPAGPGSVKLTATPSIDDRYGGQPNGYTIKAQVTVEIGDPVPH